MSYIGYLEELFDRKLDDIRILTPFICDFGNRVTFGKNVFINHSAILSASGGIEFEDGVDEKEGMINIDIPIDQQQMNYPVYIDDYVDTLYMPCGKDVVIIVEP